ncbi:hypothetical protein F2P81_021162 [Scophthalmus maximus]|uniref:Uncharacterized protein n=1 Tax=Scophthalmus maximus TaxID=52904 RepID=A0A6A4S2G2_SCOMX|nr:hypothetical protein F2P81_021162 [Scophthalmus maximus]
MSSLSKRQFGDLPPEPQQDPRRQTQSSSCSVLVLTLRFGVDISREQNKDCEPPPGTGLIQGFQPSRGLKSAFEKITVHSHECGYTTDRKKRCRPVQGDSMVPDGVREATSDPTCSFLRDTFCAATEGVTQWIHSTESRTRACPLICSLDSWPAMNCVLKGLKERVNEVKINEARTGKCEVKLWHPFTLSSNPEDFTES